MVALRSDELDEMRKAIADGKLPPDALKKYYADEEKAVFGHDFRRDREGRPIEQGLGSAAQPTRNSIEAYRIYHSKDPDFAEQLAHMEANLAKYQARRRAAAGV